MIDTNHGKFCYGAMGGVLPTLAALGATYVSFPETAMPTIGLWFGLGLYAFVGGVFAMVVVTIAEAKQVLFAGIAAPAIIANVLAGGAAGKIQKAEQPNVIESVLGISSANAQEPAPNDISDGMKAMVGSVVIVNPQVTGQYPTATVGVFAKMGDGQSTPIGYVTNFSTPSAFEVPAGASEISIGGSAIEVDQQVKHIDLNIVSAPTKINDFWWALGAPREYGIETLGVSEKK